MNADEILAVSSPSVLFKGDAQAVYRQLIKQWHPDRGAPRATEVSAHINALYAKYTPDEHSVRVKYDGRELRFHYIECRQLPYGPMFIGSENVLQCFTHRAYMLIASMVQHKFGDAVMRKEHERYLAVPINSEVVCHDVNMYALHYKKPSEYFSLAQIQRKFPVLPPEHVAWILSSLYNVNCYLAWAKRSYGGLTAETYFISPRQHNGILLGGWGSSSFLGSKPAVIPTSLNGMGDLTTKEHDSGCIRKLGRDLLGPELHKAPAPMRKWLLGLGRADSVNEYKAWEEVLTASFGKRKFVHLDFNASDLQG